MFFRLGRADKAFSAVLADIGALSRMHGPLVNTQRAKLREAFPTILTNQKNPVVSAVNVLIEDANTFKSFLADLALVP